MDDIERDRLVAWLAAEFEVQNGIDVTNEARAPQAIERLREQAERMAHETDRYEVNLPFLAADETGPKHLHVVLLKRRIDDIRAGREGPPHVDRTPRSAPPTPPEEPRESRWSDSPIARWSPILFFIALVIAIVVAELLPSLKHKHDDHDVHGQEHKR